MKGDRAERSGEREPALAQLAFKRRGLPREIAPGPELGTRVAELGHLVEHAVTRKHDAPIVELADAPRDRRRPELHDVASNGSRIIGNPGERLYLGIGMDDEVVG